MPRGCSRMCCWETSSTAMPATRAWALTAPALPPACRASPPPPSTALARCTSSTRWAGCGAPSTARLPRCACVAVARRPAAVRCWESTRPLSHVARCWLEAPPRVLCRTVQARCISRCPIRIAAWATVCWRMCRPAAPPTTSAAAAARSAAPPTARSISTSPRRASRCTAALSSSSSPPPGLCATSPSRRRRAVRAGCSAATTHSFQPKAYPTAHSTQPTPPTPRSSMRRARTPRICSLLQL